MEDYPCISGSVPAPDEGVILFPLSETVALEGTTCSGDEVFLRTGLQRGCQSRLWNGSVFQSYGLPQGQVVVWAEIPRQGVKEKEKKEMRPELGQLIDRVLVPILVARYLNRRKHVSLNEIAQ